MRWWGIVGFGMMACGGGDSTSAVVRAGPPSAVVVVSGDDQKATVAAALPQAIRVRVNDADGLAVTEQLVNFVVTKGGGTVFAGSSLTDDKGEAQEFWTLGPTAGAQELEARAIQNGLPVVLAKISATADPGPLAVARFLVDTLEVEEGQGVTLPMEAFDAYGNAVPVPAPTPLDGAMGSVVGQRWTAAGFGRARFVVAGDTLVGLARMQGGAIRMTYAVGHWYSATATLQYDPNGTLFGCGIQGQGSARWLVAYAATGFQAWRSDSLATFDWPRLEHFLCLDLRDGSFQLRYYWPDSPGAPFVGHLFPVTLTSGLGQVLSFGTGGFGPDTVTVTR